MRDWLRKAREQKKLSQHYVAQEVGVDVTSIGKYESGIRRPSPEIAKKIAELLCFDWTRFYEDEEQADA